LGLTIPTDEYETFGGFVFGLYGSFPDDGTEFDVETEAISVHAEEVRDHKLEWAVLSVKTVGEDAQDEDDGEEQSRSEKKERKERSSEK
jgi:putative hemolysin